LSGFRIKIVVSRNERSWHSLPSVDPRILFAALLVSLLIHLGSWMGATFIKTPLVNTANDAIKIRSMTAQERSILDSDQKKIAKAKRVIETKQVPTARPKIPTALGSQDHIASKETRIADQRLDRSKAADPAPTPGVSGGIEMPSQQKPKDHSQPQKVVPKIMAGPGQIAVDPGKKDPSKLYDKLLPNNSAEVFSQPKGGFVEPIDKIVAEGDRVDMNTTNFRYISYFSGLRKQIEMVWIYPSEAIRRGLQGAVQLEMVIEKDGRVSKVRVVQSSGYTTLDENMLKTIRLASPFAPLPKSWGKERLVVTGSFHYILSFASH